jgi:hypothetical protein
MSSVEQMHTIELTTGGRSVSALSKNDVMKGTMTIMVHSMTNPIDSAPLKEGTTYEESKPFPMI